MPRIDVKDLKEARMGCMAISLLKLLNFNEAPVARFTGRVPTWLETELANEGITITQDRSGKWFLEPLSD